MCQFQNVVTVEAFENLLDNCLYLGKWVFWIISFGIMFKLFISFSCINLGCKTICGMWLQLLREPLFESYAFMS